MATDDVKMSPVQELVHKGNLWPQEQKGKNKDSKGASKRQHAGDDKMKMAGKDKGRKGKGGIGGAFSTVKKAMKGENTQCESLGCELAPHYKPKAAREWQVRSCAECGIDDHWRRMFCQHKWRAETLGAEVIPDHWYWCIPCTCNFFDCDEVQAKRIIKYKIKWHRQEARACGYDEQLIRVCEVESGEESFEDVTEDSVLVYATSMSRFNEKIRMVGMKEMYTIFETLCSIFRLKVIDESCAHVAAMGLWQYLNDLQMADRINAEKERNRIADRLERIRKACRSDFSDSEPESDTWSETKEAMEIAEDLSNIYDTDIVRIGAKTNLEMFRSVADYNDHWHTEGGEFECDWVEGKETPGKSSTKTEESEAEDEWITGQRWYCSGTTAAYNLPVWGGVVMFEDMGQCYMCKSTTPYNHCKDFKLTMVDNRYGRIKTFPEFYSAIPTAVPIDKEAMTRPVPNLEGVCKFYRDMLDTLPIFEWKRLYNMNDVAERASEIEAREAAMSF